MNERGSATITVANVSVAFGGIAALTDVSMKLQQREVFGLIGPNGAGKTTMVNVLSGFQRPTQGSVTLDGIEVGARGPHYAARIGVGRTFQAGRLFRDLTVGENLTIAAMGAGMGMRKARWRAGAILNWMGCEDMAQQRCDSLSYGNERRIGIGRALALAPKFVLLDEPASGMNDAESDALMRLIASIPGEFDCGVLLIEHNMEVIMGACERIHVLDGGRTIAEGNPAAIMHNPDVRRAYLGDKGKGGVTPVKAA
ncbi:ABC transporter ATP-binding protein [Paraburkholderia silvatlantica]|uniref:ABC transporter ATP-binding protein n=1 Tax=Paraburkholderia silvatlantica TaxID=321895 RepID=UPI001061EBB3|nr:ABC transporter ATP-binding protein [Paraburkholderia silvatlantica]TDQ92242.1 amino acid/amide ABC transporter ATP-binding protein 1 (HAAT family) [Paraburkholderia silvatlantica]